MNVGQLRHESESSCMLLNKQSPGALLRKMCSIKFCKIHRKTLVPEPLFLMNLNIYSKRLYYQRDSSTGVFL